MEATANMYRSRGGSTRKKYNKDIKAIHTTLYILGSFVLTRVTERILISFRLPINNSYVFQTLIFHLLKISRLSMDSIIYLFSVKEIVQARAALKDYLEKIFCKRKIPKGTDDCLPV